MIDQKINLSQKQKDWFSVLIILITILIRFYQTVFFKQSISKIYLTAHWDSLFYPLKNGPNFGMDSTFSSLQIPYRFFVSELWHHGIPFWNYLNGFGTPLLADPQSCAFSPIYTLFTLFPNLHTWNITLIFQLFIAGICVYFFCREMQFNSIAGLSAAALFIFCPYLQWQIELVGTGFCLTPFVFLFFTRMANRGTATSIILTGLSVAIVILSAHPEIAFVSTFCASIWTYVCCYLKKPRLQTLIATSKHIGFAGLVAFGLSAPMLIPFLEYLTNAQTYKLDAIAAAGLPWQAIFANYLFPYQSQASIFFGPLSLWGILYSFVFIDRLNRFTKPLILLLIISLIGLLRPIPFNVLFYLPPLSMTFATYWLPEYLLSISVLSGIGCAHLIKMLFEESLLKDKPKFFIILSIGLILSLIPLIYTPWHHENPNLVFDQTFALPQFNFKVWLSCTLLSIFILYLLSASQTKSFIWKLFASFIFVFSGLSILVNFSFRSLPLRPLFKYPNKLPFQAEPFADRIVSIGNHLFKPETNLIYKLPLLQCSNPMFPKGFITFTQACGAEIDQYSQIFSPILSPLLQLAGVNKIISEQPVIDQSLLESKQIENLTVLKTKTITAHFENLLDLTNIQLFYDRKANNLFFTAQAIFLRQTENFHLCFYLIDNHGQPLTFLEPVLVTNTKPTVFCSVNIPKRESNWSVAIKILEDKHLRFLKPHPNSNQTVLENTLILAGSNTPDEFIGISDKRFKLTAKNGNIFEYQDTGALKRCFLVKKIIWVSNNKAALEYIKSHTRELKDTAVLEKQDFDSKIKFDDIGDANHFGSSNIETCSPTPHTNISEVELQTETRYTSFLVLSNIYYPGWQAYIDNQKTKIFRTDYLFSGITVPAGKHIIKFIYQPLSFIIGLWLLCITIGLILLSAFIASRNKQPSR